ncbi:MAG: M48 family metalloprotease [Candidatus Omnitrophota bacterium]|nr:MAG: M48 family metalloprotease [Candidatus Omnitrophota bacterium]
MKKYFFIFILTLFLILSTSFLPSNLYAAKSIAVRIEEKVGLDEDATLQEKVDIIGQKLAAVCDRKDIVYTFKVLKPDKVNAFTLADGHIYIYRGLIDKFKSDDEIAAVLGHEIGHIVAGHHKKRRRTGIIANIFRIVAVGGADTIRDKININNAINELTLSYSREEEIEADEFSVTYLKRAGFNPEAAISMIEVLIKSELEGPIRPKRRWRTHPYLSDRIRAIRKEIQGSIDFVDYINVPTRGLER